MISNLLKNIKSRSSLSADILKIYFENFTIHPPIIIYQMGKVGSSTIYSSLKSADIPNAIYQVHFLSLNGIKSTEAYLKSLKEPTPSHLRISRALRYKLALNREAPARIITLVRDPVARKISSLFQNLRLHRKRYLDEIGNLKQSVLIDDLKKYADTFDETSDYCCSWFDTEFKAFLDIDPFKYDFDKENGFGIIEKNNIKVLILRMEDLNNIFSNAISSFLAMKEHRVQLCSSNIGSQKKYSNVYQDVLLRLKLDRPTCEKIYSSKYVSHFYNEKLKDRFLQKWTT
jgi:hypothetical protein